MRGPDNDSAGTRPRSSAAHADPDSDAHSMGMLAHLVGSVLGCVLGGARGECPGLVAAAVNKVAAQQR